MRRSALALGFHVWLLAAFTLSAALECGDLVIPNNTSDDGGGDDGTLPTADAVPVDARPPPDCDAGTEPVALACTRLYSDWTQLTLASDVVAYQPGVTMWADGADSSRWIWLPPGQKTIDTHDLNNWTFPVNTKIWQEFRLLGRRIETRFLWKETSSMWFRTTFVWNDDESAAPAVQAGVPNVHGLPYEVVAVNACEKCHDGAADFVLGFELVGLSLPQSSGLNLQALVRAGTLSNPPTATASLPGNPATAASLTFLHANCGTSCHNRGPSAGAGVYGPFLKLTVDASGALPATAQQTDTWTTTYGVPSSLTPYGYDAGGFWRIAPGDPAHSSVVWTASRRDGVAQMPPIGTHLVDQNDMANLASWIGSL